jgi:GNAT superfamily N-acetyltransferase
MLDRWYSCIRLPMSSVQFEQLPQNSAYQYEYAGGFAMLSPRPKTLNGLLELKPMMAAHAPTAIRPLEDRDWDQLPAIFADAFCKVQPFSSLSNAERLQASQECLEQTRNAGDGPLIQEASFLACGEYKEIIGGILVTLIPARPEGEWWTGKWPEPPPANALQLRLGRPHLTWVFVDGRHAGQGFGTLLLGHAVNALLKLGYRELASTFLIGNDASTLWHWRNGFRLVPYAGSK